MKVPYLRAFLLAAALLASALALAPSSDAAPPRVLAVRFALDVNPVTADYLDHQISGAAKNGYAAVVILLDTPGGLSDSMRKIVQTELSAPVPVIVYVWPRGARAASAGVWISQAADVLAMAPETNIGSSTPIQSSGQNIGSDLRRKEINDAAASLRGLAASHGRNAQWADQAVRVASNLTAQEALARNVIDLTAPSLTALLDKLDGYRTKGPGRAFTLHLAGAQAVETGPGFFTRFLDTLIDPNLLSLLFLAGLVGIGYEIFHPGIVLPGAFGAISLLTALFGFSILPISWAALALVLLGIALLVIDAHVVTHGALTISGLASLVVGLLLLFHNAPAPYHTSVPLVVSIAVALGGFWTFALTKAAKARRMPVTTGAGSIVGSLGHARGEGLVWVRGELWQARSPGDEPLREGEPVEVTGLDGLVLEVRPLRATARTH